MIKLFLCIFRDFMGIFKTLKTKFFWPRTAAARLGRSTVAVDRRARIRARWLPHKPVDRTVDRLRAGCSRVAPGRPARELLLSGSGAGRPSGRPVAASGQK